MFNFIYSIHKHINIYFSYRIEIDIISSHVRFNVQIDDG